VSVERGHDPREFALVAYGGAGPLHACALAEELGTKAVLVPTAAGVLSALGLAVSDERRDRVVSHVRPLAAVADLPEEGEVDLRYMGQSFELAVPLGPDLEARFHRMHEERYGYAERGRQVELVAVRTAEVVPGPELELPGVDPRHLAGPALIELEGSTLWIPPGWEGVRDGPSWVVTRE
jgi:N-methylhydantoinase A